MKAIVTYQYGSPDVLQLEERDKPEPKEGELRVKVKAASVNAADWHLLRADPSMVRFMMGFIKPKIEVLGMDVAGIVEAVGEGVTDFNPGDEVMGDLADSDAGAYAEFACGKAEAFVKKPASITFEEAAAIPLAAGTALIGVRDKAQTKPGMKVLVHGSSGGVGTYTVQLAKHFGAEVTAVCSTKNMETARSLGADHVIDYTKEDFTQNGELYDVIFAIGGNRPMSEYKRSLNEDGIYVMMGGSNRQIFESLLLGPFFGIGSGKRSTTFTAKTTKEDLQFLKELVEAGKLKAVIDRRFPLEQVPDAIRYIEEGHPSGKVVITVG